MLGVRYAFTFLTAYCLGRVITNIRSLNDSACLVGDREDLRTLPYNTKVMNNHKCISKACIDVSH